MRRGDVIALGPYKVGLEELAQRRGPNCLESYAVMRIERGGQEVARIEPGNRLTRRASSRAEAGIVTRRWAGLRRSGKLTRTAASTSGSITSRLSR